MDSIEAQNGRFQSAGAGIARQAEHEFLDPADAWEKVGAEVENFHALIWASTAAASDAVGCWRSRRALMNRAGFPATMVHGSTSRVTTAPAPTIAPSPTVTPGWIKAPAAIQT